MKRTSFQTIIPNTLLTLLVSLMLISSMFPVSFGQQTQLKVVVPTDDIPLLTSGQKTRFKVNITVVDVPPEPNALFSWQIKLYYNTTVLKFINGTLPPGHVFDGKVFFPGGPFSGSDANGTYILFSASLSGSESRFSGSGILCQISFEANATGTSSLNFSRPLGGKTYLWNFDLNDIPAILVDGSVDVVEDLSPPITNDDYDGLWRTTDFTINLTATDNAPSSGIAETYYRINDGAVQNVRTYGQPHIIPEGANNKLEYWSVDKAGNEEQPHKVLTGITGIKIDKTSPLGSVLINNNATYTTSPLVNLTVTATDAPSGVNRVRYSNDGVWDNEPWENPSPTKAWALTSGDGAKTVYYQVRDNAGLVSQAFSDVIVLDMTPPTVSIIQPLNGSEVRGTSVTVNWNATDDASGVSYYRIRLDGGSWISTGTDETFTFTGLGDGSHTVEVIATNNVGKSMKGTVSFFVNTSLFLGPGTMEETIVLAIAFIAIIGVVVVYFLKIRRHK